MSKAREPAARSSSRASGPQHAEPPPTLEEVLERSHVAGSAPTLEPVGAAALVERAAADRRRRVPLDDAWAVGARGVRRDAARSRGSIRELTIAAARRAVARISEVASTRRAHRPGDEPARRRCSPSTSRSPGSPGSRAARSPTTTTTRARCASTAGPTARLRWVDGVAVVTDGQSLCATRGPEAAQEWLFLIPRPALVIADGPYADVALDAGIEVIALGGPRPLLARGRRRTGPALPRRADVDGPGARRVPPLARDGAGAALARGTSDPAPALITCGTQPSGANGLGSVTSHSPR